MTGAEMAAAIADAAQVLAILFAGGFTYFKFLHGRTLKLRAEVQVSAELYSFMSEPALLVRVSVANRGLAKIPLHQAGAWVDVKSVTSPTWGVGEAMWVDGPSDGARAAVLGGHTLIEPGELIADEQLLVLQPADESGFAVAYKVEVVVASRSTRIRRTSEVWGASAVVPTNALRPLHSPDGEGAR